MAGDSIVDWNSLLKGVRQVMREQVGHAQEGRPQNGLVKMFLVANSSPCWTVHMPDALSQEDVFSILIELRDFIRGLRFEGNELDVGRLALGAHFLKIDDLSTIPQDEQYVEDNCEGFFDEFLRLHAQGLDSLGAPESVRRLLRSLIAKMYAAPRDVGTGMVAASLKRRAKRMIARAKEAFGNCPQGSFQVINFGSCGCTLNITSSEINEHHCRQLTALAALVDEFVANEREAHTFAYLFLERETHGDTITIDDAIFRAVALFKDFCRLSRVYEQLPAMFGVDQIPACALSSQRTITPACLTNSQPHGTLSSRNSVNSRAHDFDVHSHDADDEDAEDAEDAAASDDLVAAASAAANSSFETPLAAVSQAINAGDESEQDISFSPHADNSFDDIYERSSTEPDSGDFGDHDDAMMPTAADVERGEKEGESESENEDEDEVEVEVEVVEVEIALAITPPSEGRSKRSKKPPNRFCDEYPTPFIDKLRRPEDRKAPTSSDGESSNAHESRRIGGRMTATCEDTPIEERGCADMQSNAPVISPSSGRCRRQTREPDRFRDRFEPPSLLVKRRLEMGGGDTSSVHESDSSDVAPEIDLPQERRQSLMRTIEKTMKRARKTQHSTVASSAV